MGFNRFTKSVLNISGLPDRVQNQATTLKALFDQAGVDIKEALNALMTELEASTSANNIGADVSTVATKTVQAILTAYEEAIADRYTKLEAGTLVLEETNNLVADVDVNLTTGVITVTKKDGTVETFDTAIEKVPAKFEIVETNGGYALKITNLDGTSTQTDVTTLMNIYTFNASDTINFEVAGEGNERTVVANIKANSIGLDKLSLTVISTIEGYVNNAKNSADAAKASEIIATNKAEEARNHVESCSILAQTVHGLYTQTVNTVETAIDKADEAAASAAEAKKWAEQAGGAAGDLSGYYTKVETDEKIEEAISSIEIPDDCNIPKFVGTQENPIDFSNLFEGIGNATDGWYQGNRMGQCLLEGYVKVLDGSVMTIGEILQPPDVAMTVKDVLVNYTYVYVEGMPALLFQTMFSENFAIKFTAIAGVGYYGEREDLGVALKSMVLEKNVNNPFTPTLDYHPATKKYVDDKKQTFTATIPTTGWATTAPYYVDIAIEGMLGTDLPHITPAYTGTVDTDKAIQEAWSKIDTATANSGSLRITAFEEKPSTAIPVQIEVIR